MFSVGMLRPGSVWMPAAPSNSKPNPLLTPDHTKATAGLDARRVDGKLPETPTSPSASPMALAPVDPKAVSLASSTANASVEDRGAIVLKEAEGFCRHCNEVRVTNKADLKQRRAELNKHWPDFEKTYDTYRQWRDCRRVDPKYPDLEAKGKQAQLEIMKRSGVLGSGEMALFSLLGAGNAELLRYVSPINGDFRAPGAGIVAGLRFEIVKQGDKETRVPVLAFPGTGSGAMIRAQMKANVRQFLGLGGPPDAYRIGADLAKAVSSRLPRDFPSLQLVGHSLGGGIASFSAALNDLPCLSFNPAALGGASLRYLRTTCEDFPASAARQTVIRVKNDHVSSPAMQRRLAAAIILGMNPLFETPTHIGSVHVIPREHLPEKHRGTMALHNLRAIVGMYDAAEAPQEGSVSTATV